jgi:hypothetical protein
MRMITKAALAGIASLALAAPLAAQTVPVHKLSVALPGGGIAEIRYSGDVPPQVALLPGPAPLLADFPALPSFAQLAAAMDVQATALLQQVAMLAQQPAFAFDRPLAIDFAQLPPGAVGYEASATLGGNGWCSESVTVTRDRPNAAPKVVRHASGNCGGAAASSGPAAPVEAVPTMQRPQPQRLMVRSAPPQQSPATVQRVAWQR